MTDENGFSTGPLLRMEGIVKLFPGVRANDGIDFAVNAGEVHTLLGENGAGKTTLMRTLIGLYAMDAGKTHWKGEEVHINSAAKAGKLGIGMVHQQFSLIPNFTVAENVALGTREKRSFKIDLKPISQKIQNMADEFGFGLQPNARIDQLSMGARQRVEIIKILYRNAELLILDEPSSVLTPQEVQDLFKVIRKLINSGKSVVFISHKLDEVMDISNRITVLRDGKVVGDIPVKEANPKKLSKLMVGREVLFTLEKNEVRRGKPVLQVTNLNAIRDGIRLLKNVSFNVCAGEILGVAGVAGNGQEVLIQILAGMQKSTSGSVAIDGINVTNGSPEKIKQNGLSYMPSDRRGTGLVLQMNLRENLILRDFNSKRFCKFGFMRQNAIQDFSIQAIHDFDIRVASDTATAGTLSGGNQQKVVAAREFSHSPKILIAEQPTMGLDIGATEYVRSRLLKVRDDRKAILLVSTELNEIFALSDRVIVMFRGEIMGEVNPKKVSVQDVGLLMAGKRMETILDEVE
jgi:simple sugar transport system ATP-binding protein